MAVKVTVCPNIEGFGDEVSAAIVVGARFTTWLSTGEVLTEKLAFPPYTAVMGWVPTLRMVVLKVATPALSVTVPRVVVPFLKVTEPVGVPVAEETVALKVTACP